MNKDDDLAIIALCSQLSDYDIKPLETKEWAEFSKILINNKKTPKDLFNFNDYDYNIMFNNKFEIIDRVKKLLLRASSLAFEIEKINKFGISIVTRASKEYPSRLKTILGQQCPPLFYYVGDLDILNNNFIGFVGSRDINNNDEIRLKKLVNTAVNLKYGIVSGGAKGVDSTATEECLNAGGFAVEYLSDSMLKKIKNSKISTLIRNGRLLLLSSVKPNAGFNVGIAMQRNKFIYAQSSGTVIIKSQYNEGGTWNGAIENLNKNWVDEYCINDLKYVGNVELIKRGAIPIDENFDFNLKGKKINKQQSMFD